MKIVFSLLKSLCATLFLCLVASAASGQFNDSVHHLVSLNASGNFNRTSDGITYLFNNSAKYSLRKKSMVLNANASYLYGQTPSALTNNDVKSTLDFNLYKTLPHFYYWGLLNFTSSYSLKINNQFQGGLGVAYRIIDKEETMFSISDGFLLERSDVIAEADSNYIYGTIRNSLRLQFRTRYKDIVTFNSTGFYQPSLTIANDYIITAHATLSFKLWKWINLATSISYNRVSRTGRENLIFTYGLTIERYF